jgi:glucokinase
MREVYAVGIDIGGTFTKAGLVAADGTVAHLIRIPTAAHSDPTEYLDRLHALLSEWTAEHPVGIGISLPGFLAPDLRSIRFNPNTPSLVGIDFVSLFGSFRLPVRIEQDLNTPSLSEHAFGAGRGSVRFMTASMGTGAGVGVMIDGDLLRFTGNSAGDTGHIILEPDGPACQVGCHGCAEALVTISAVEREARSRLAGRDVPQEWRSLSPEFLAARQVIEAARAGDAFAVEIMSLIGRRIGQWLACLAPIFLPDRIALCGGIVEAGASLLEACRERFLQLTAADYARCEIVLGRFGELAGVTGAATPFLIQTGDSRFWR